ncbi:MAG: DUF4125 family protein [Olsenella sp.]|jgi:hypothetical protein|nr:DUF4125 family protein [Olsenella sp.]MCI1289404.1 DUF4125 family protein [Olsenella sp.]
MNQCACDCDSYGRRLYRRRGIEALFSLPGVVSIMEECGLNEQGRSFLQRLVVLEWEQFDSVLNAGGRASCQDDPRPFFAYRCAQYLAFPHQMIPRILGEFEQAEGEGRNLVEEKYARMMAVTDPSGYQRDWAARLGTPSPVKAQALDDVRKLLSPALEEAAGELPESHRHARPDASTDGRVSSLDYFMAEAATYSLGTVFALRDALRAELYNRNPVALSYVLSVRLLKSMEANA